MPKDTYFHLPEAKQKRIFDAAINEVISVPLNEVSINRIIQKAQISRGSFYQYFDDKQDLILFVLGDGIRYIKDGFARCIEKSEGDIFCASSLILEEVFSLGKKDVYRQTLRNILVESGTRECSHNFLVQLQMDLLTLLEEKMDKQKLRLKEAQEYKNLTRIVFVLLKEAAIGYLYDSNDADIHRKEFASQLSMIKEGVML